MPTFAYKAMTADGKTRSGSLDATDRKAALRKLKAQALRPLDISLRGDRQAAATPKAAPEVKAEDPAQDKPVSKRKLFAPKSGPKLAHAFLTKLLQLHGSGMPLGDAVSLIAQRVREAGLQRLAQELYRDLSEGHTLAAAMRRHPKTFDPATPFLIEAGEATGNLKPILENLIQHLEEMAEIKRRVRAGLAYPMLIAIFAIGLGILCVTFLIPTVQGVLDSLGGELNMLSRIMIGLSDFTVSWGPILAGGLLVAVAALMQWRRTPKGRAWTDRWLLRLPFTATIIRAGNLSRLANIMNILMSNGVNTTESLRLAENTLTNTHLRGQFSAARNLIQDGAPFSSAFRRYGIMTASDLDILTVGENTGSLVNAFHEIAQLHMRNLSQAFVVLRLTITTAAFGIVIALVATLILTILLALFQVQETISAQ